MDADNLTCFTGMFTPNSPQRIPVTEPQDKFWCVCNFLLSFEEQKTQYLIVWLVRI